jgi:hypothetical protein
MSRPTQPMLNPIDPTASGPRVRAIRIETSMPSALPNQVLPSSNRDLRPRSWRAMRSDSIAPAPRNRAGNLPKSPKFHMIRLR